MTVAEKSHAEKIITLEITRWPNNVARIGLARPCFSVVREHQREKGEESYIKHLDVLINNPHWSTHTFTERGSYVSTMAFQRLIQGLSTTKTSFFHVQRN